MASNLYYLLITPEEFHPCACPFHTTSLKKCEQERFRLPKIILYTCCAATLAFMTSTINFPPALFTLSHSISSHVNTEKAIKSHSWKPKRTTTKSWNIKFVFCHLSMDIDEGEWGERIWLGKKQEKTVVLPSNNIHHTMNAIQRTNTHILYPFTKLLLYCVLCVNMENSFPYWIF